MNKKLKNIITDTADLLKLTQTQTEYLANVLEIVYLEGNREGFLEGKVIYDRYAKRINEIFEEGK